MFLWVHVHCWRPGPAGRARGSLPPLRSHLQESWGAKKRSVVIFVALRIVLPCRISALERHIGICQKVFQEKRKVRACERLLADGETLSCGLRCSMQCCPR